LRTMDFLPELHNMTQKTMQLQTQVRPQTLEIACNKLLVRSSACDLTTVAHTLSVHVKLQLDKQRIAFEAMLKQKDQHIAELTSKLKQYQDSDTSTTGSKRPRLNKNANDSNCSQQHSQGKTKLHSNLRCSYLINSTTVVKLTLPLRTAVLQQREYRTNQQCARVSTDFYGYCMCFAED
jgi:hypothetical protein